MSVENLVNKALYRIGRVHPVVKQGAEEIVRRAYKEGIYVLYSAGYRSYAEQDTLYAQGRTKPGSIVTNARGGQSYHNFGLALDFYLTNELGTTGSWVYNTDWKRVATIAKGLGFEWGGDWRSFVDRPHLQMTGGLSLAQLRAGHKPNIALKGGTITPNILQKGATGPAVTKLQSDLIKLGYNLGKSGADGKFGSATEIAVREFQKDNKLKVDGIVDNDTFSAINNLLKGELSVSAEERLQKQIDELKEQLKGKQNTPSSNQTPSPTHSENWEEAKILGLFNGKDPHQNVTREQLATVLVRLISTFIRNKSKAEEYAKEALKWAEENGISNTENPAYFASRQQVITMLKRAVDVVEEDIRQENKLEEDNEA